MIKRRTKTLALRAALVFVLAGFSIWSYLFFWQNLDRVRWSRRMTETVLENKTEQAEQYARDLGMTRESLRRTEAFLGDLKAENVKLKEKVALLDQLNDLEREIHFLREENAKMNDVLREARAGVQPGLSADEEDDFDSVPKGRSFIEKMRQRIRAAKARMSALMRRERERQQARQKEIDQHRMLLGNNGYLVRGGQPMPMDMPEPDPSPGAGKVKVEFFQ